MMPADIQGTSILVEKAGGGQQVEFREGPLVANVVLADEINRATPKTQSALLEAMQEKQLTIGNRTIKLDEPYCVMATQNPVEQEGTYPLPEAQLDRFLFKLVVGYPQESEYHDILNRTTSSEDVRISHVSSGKEINMLRENRAQRSGAETRAELRGPARHGHSAEERICPHHRQRLRLAGIQPAGRPEPAPRR